MMGFLCSFVIEMKGIDESDIIIYMQINNDHDHYNCHQTNTLL